MVGKVWKRAIQAQDRQRTVASAPVRTPLVCHLPCGLSLEVDPETREAVSVYSGVCSSIGLMMILNPHKYRVKTIH
jgi:hypothetical protein